MAKRTAATDQGVRLAEAREQMVVVGVDAALAKTGWAVIIDDAVVATGVIKTSPREPEPDRLWCLYSEVGEVLRRYRTRRTVVAIERPGDWVRGAERSSLRTIEALAASRAVVKIMARWQDCTAVDLDVNEARRLILGQTHGVTGAGGHGKRWVRDLVEMRFRVTVSHDEADAVVIGAAGYSLWKCSDARFPPST